MKVNRSRNTLALSLALLYIVMSLGPELVWAENESRAWQISRDIHYTDSKAPDRQYQTLDIYWKDNEKRRPVIIYVHGGGWAFGDKADVQAKPDYFVGHGLAFVSMNYRLRWDYKVEHQAQDIATVVKWVRDNAETYGFDPAKIILMGSAAGAHLVSLVGTNEKFLGEQGLSPSALTAVIAMDSESYDIPRLMDELGTFVQRRHHRVIFGEDRETWVNASPITHVEPDKDFPAFALLYLEDEPSVSQAKTFARRLSDAGAEVIMIPANQKTRETFDSGLGRQGDEPTKALMTFIRALI